MLPDHQGAELKHDEACTIANVCFMAATCPQAVLGHTAGTASSAVLMSQHLQQQHSQQLSSHQQQRSSSQPPVPA